jgi:hypothetical protein
MQYSTAIRNARADIVTQTIGASARLELFSGPIPRSCEEADPKSLIVTIALPSPFLTKAKDGMKQKVGDWHGTATAAGTPSFYRFSNSKGCAVQGPVSELRIDKRMLTEGEEVHILGFRITSGNK